MRDFQQLAFWQRSHQLTLKIYQITREFPREELYGLISQIRRSASSVPTNIAEGCGRNSLPDLKRFLIISSGSASELHYQLILSRDLNYISNQLFKELEGDLIQIKKMIYTYSLKLISSSISES
jgi:four helix bundle protein